MSLYTWERASLPRVSNHVYLGHVRTVSVYMGRVSAHVCHVCIYRRRCITSYRGHEDSFTTHMRCVFWFQRTPTHSLCIYALYLCTRVCVVVSLCTWEQINENVYYFLLRIRISYDYTHVLCLLIQEDSNILSLYTWEHAHHFPVSWPMSI